VLLQSSAIMLARVLAAGAVVGHAAEAAVGPEVVAGEGPAQADLADEVGQQEVAGDET
jgi:hypothetical protein